MKGFWPVIPAFLLSIALCVATLIATRHDACASAFVQAQGDQLSYNGVVYKIKGTNYYPRNHMWADMWSSWDWNEITYEATLMQQFGLNSVRILVPYASGGWNGGTSPARLQQLEDLVNVLGQNGIRSCVTLFDWETSWPAAGSPTETAHKLYIDAIVGRLKNNPYVFMWDVKNEPDNPANIGGLDDWNAPGAQNKVKIVSWLQRMCGYVKSVDSNHPVSVGMRWYNNVQDVLPFVDIACFHSYWWPITKTTEIPTIKAAMGGNQKPIIAEEFGWPTNGGRENCTPDPGFTESEQLTLYQKELEAFAYHNIAGCLQWMTFDARTYRNNPCDSFEQFNGIWKYDYALKPAGVYYRDNWPAQAFPVEQDVTPPGAVTGFAASPGDTYITLSWKNPADSDFTHTVVRASVSGYPSGPADGMAVCEVYGASGANVSFTHYGLTNGTDYYYSAFAFDSSGNTSTGAFVTGRPAQAVGGDRCGAVKRLADGTSVILNRKILTGNLAVDGALYVQEPDRSAGIRVLMPNSTLAPGDTVTVTGTLSTRYLSGAPSERQITNATVILISPGAGSSPIPLAMTVREIGGESVAPGVVGVTGGVGLNNIGLLAKVTGRVTSSLISSCWVDDGSGVNGGSSVLIRCPSPALTPAPGDMIAVVGIVEGNVAIGQTENSRLLRMRTWSDLTRLNQ